MHTTRYRDWGLNLYVVPSTKQLQQGYLREAFSISQKTFHLSICLCLSPQRLNLSKVTSFIQTKIGNWYKTVNVGCIILICPSFMYAFIICSFLSWSNVNSLLSNVSIARIVSFLYECSLLLLSRKNKFSLR